MTPELTANILIATRDSRLGAILRCALVWPDLQRPDRAGIDHAVDETITKSYT